MKNIQKTYDLLHGEGYFKIKFVHITKKEKIGYNITHESGFKHRIYLDNISDTIQSIRNAKSQIQKEIFTKRKKELDYKTKLELLIKEKNFNSYNKKELKFICELLCNLVEDYESEVDTFVPPPMQKDLEDMISRL